MLNFIMQQLMWRHENNLWRHFEQPIVDFGILYSPVMAHKIGRDDSYLNLGIPRFK